MSSVAPPPSGELEPAWEVARLFPPQGHWSEGLAVGSRPFVERVVREVGRMQVSYTELPSSGAEAWCVRDAQEIAYSVKRGGETGS